MENKFCENCGNKLSETAKFCANCGAQVESSISSNTEVKSTLSGKEPAVGSKIKEIDKPKSPKGWQGKLIRGIVAAVVVGTMLWAEDTFFSSNSYPQKQTEFENLLFNTSWHLTNYEIKELYFNGEQIFPAKDAYDNTLKMVIDGLKHELDKTIEDYGCFFICGADDKRDGFSIYSQYFDDSFGEYVYEIATMEIMGKDDNGEFRYSTNDTGIEFSVKTGEPTPQTEDGISTKSSLIVKSITEEKMELFERHEYSGEVNIVLVVNAKYKPIFPTVDTRHESEIIPTISE